MIGPAGIEESVSLVSKQSKIFKNNGVNDPTI